MHRPTQARGRAILDRLIQTLPEQGVSDSLPLCTVSYARNERRHQSQTTDLDSLPLTHILSCPYHSPHQFITLDSTYLSTTRTVSTRYYLAKQPGSTVTYLISNHESRPQGTSPVDRHQPSYPESRRVR
jgi:hypothetical protein